MKTSREELLVKLSLLFFEEGLTQTEIAKRLGISRPTVASMIKEAKDRGIVKISIQHTDLPLFKQQDELKQKYQLKSVSIAAKSDNPKQEVGMRCVELIEPMLNDMSTLGLGWGTTVYEFVEQAHYFHTTQLKIIPLVGGMGMSHVRYHANHLAFKLAQKYDSDVSYFYAPAIAESLELKKNFDESQLVKTVVNEGRQVDFAILSAGNPIESSSYKKFGYLTQQDYEELVQHHAIGDIGATFFNPAGEPLHTNVSDRMIGVALTDLAEIPNVVVLGSGQEKIASIKILLELGVVDHLIIDQQIAAEL